MHCSIARWHFEHKVIQFHFFHKVTDTTSKPKPNPNPYRALSKTCQDNATAVQSETVVQ